MNALVLVDKPPGITCARIDLLVREWSGEKVAHAGTLDPQVTGVLPLLIGKKAIKLLEYLQKSEKEYVCLMRVQNAQEERVKEVLKEFVGKVYQTPPETSAVAKKTRVRKIYRIDILDIDGDYFLIKVACQHGTYIRVLVRDVGRVLGTKTEMIELRRIRSNGFSEEECVPLVRLKDALSLENPPEGVLLPLEEAVRSLPKIKVKKTAEKNIIKGAPVMAPGVLEKNGHIQKGKPVAILSEDGKLIGVGIAEYDKNEFPERGIVVRTRKVLA